jgi:phage protein D
MPPQSPIDIKDPVLRLSVTVDGKPLEAYFPVLSLDIIHEVNRISTAELSIIFQDIVHQDTSLKEEERFRPGSPIEIKAAYGNDAAETTLFKGAILKRKIKVRQSGSYTMNVSCSHGARNMTFNKNAAEFSNKTDSDIIRAIVSTYPGLTCKAEVTSPALNVMLKTSGSSDWDFILARAEFNGKLVIPDGDTLVVAAPNPDTTPVLRVAFGESIYSFDAEIDTENQPKTVTSRSWDIKGLNFIEVKAKEPTLPEPLKSAIKASATQQVEPPVLKSNTGMARDELQTWGDGRLLRIRMGALKGQVSFIGNGMIKPGDNIQLAGTGPTFDGCVFVSSVNHSIEEGGWTTTVKFGLENKSVTENKNFTPPAAGGQLPPIHGLQVATVKQLSGDPTSEFRVQIVLPSQSADPQPIWARVANLHATSKAGSVFFPDVGDEVVAGFFESDPRYPVILGSLYSTSKASPQPMEDENNFVKSLTTRSGLKMSFDDENKILKIITPAGNTIVLDDKGKDILLQDQHSNKITMNSTGIQLDTGKDITLKATGDINLEATGKLNMSAKQDAALSGMNITHDADIGFTAKGKASAELSATGQTTVKGGMVMIN